MTALSHSIIYLLLFISLYFEVFMLITYLENRGEIKKEGSRVGTEPAHYPTVSIIVPCWNEETTLSKTVESLLKLDYPKDKYEVLIVDDGSTDNTLAVAKTFESYSNVRVFTKENGGKHTALNFGLLQSTSDLVGCLDADSYVDSQALKDIVSVFESDKTLSAVTPSVKIYQPKSIIQLIQSVEYIWAIFLRKMLAFMGAIYVTPGPFSIFKREVFAQVGNYRHAYMTEDMEMAMRMQAHKLKIGNSHTATIYTSAPESLKKLYKQRLRWTYGFIKNAADYRFMFFKKDYGNLGLFILPLAVISIFATVYAAGTMAWGFIKGLMNQVEIVKTVGFHLPQWSFSFDLFYVNTQIIALASLIAFIGSLIILFISRKMTLGKIRLGLDMVYFVAIYSFIAPIWLAKALYNAIFSVTTNWR